MKKYLFILIAFLNTTLTFAQSNLMVAGIKLGRSYDEVVNDFKAKELTIMGTGSQAVVFIGSFYGIDNSLISVVNTNGMCYGATVMFPEQSDGDHAFSLFSDVKSKMLNEYGGNFKIDEVYENNLVNKNSTPNVRYREIQNGNGLCAAVDSLADGNTILLGIQKIDNIGTRVTAMFIDKNMPSSEKSEETQTVKPEGTPTRFKGLEVNTSVKALVRNLKEKGLRDEATSLEKEIYAKNNVVKLVGMVMGVPGCDVIIAGADQVEFVTINFPVCDTWKALYQQYSKIKDAILSKYRPSKFHAVEQIEEQTENLDKIENYKALAAISRGNYSMQTSFVNSVDLHIIKVYIIFIVLNLNIMFH